jgi:sugar phosphate isomerase/epimerase
MKLATKVEPNKTKLDTLARIGWKNLEIWTDEGIIENIGATSLLNEYDFEYAVHSPTDYFDMTVVDFASYIGARVINTHKIVPNEDLARYVAYAKSKDITVTVENEAFPESHHLKDGTVLQTIVPDRYDPIRSAGDFKRLQEEVPHVKLCIDVEHALIRKEWPAILHGVVVNQDVGHIHLCGFAGGAHHQPVYENMGLVDQVSGLLRASGYQGFVICEHDIEFHTEEIWTETLERCGPLFGA